MAHANRNTLHRSKLQLERQQREVEVPVPGATGSTEDVSAEAAAEKARNRLGKTEKHTSDDGPPSGAQR